jgi:hypothetical protein
VAVFTGIVFICTWHTAIFFTQQCFLDAGKSQKIFNSTMGRPHTTKIGRGHIGNESKM